MINHSKLTNILNSIQTKKVLVLGDIMLDQYIFGSVERVSPEAPIPIININNTSYPIMSIQSDGALLEFTISARLIYPSQNDEEYKNLNFF